MIGSSFPPSFVVTAALCAIAVTVVLGDNHHDLRHIDDHDRMSRHLQVTTNNLTDIIMLLDIPATEGPYAEREDDYITSVDMTSAAKAGSPGIDKDRLSVINGIPMNLTFKIYEMDATGTNATESEGVEVFIWHTDAKGIYSAVRKLSLQFFKTKATRGQKWLRGRQVTDASGIVNFQTIVPGWYSGRSIHYHVRCRLPGEKGYVATTQLFLSDDFLSSYENTEPYASNRQKKTLLKDDYISNKVMDEDLVEALTLDPVGSLSEGYAAELSIGLTLTNDSGHHGIFGCFGQAIQNVRTVVSFLLYNIFGL